MSTSVTTLGEVLPSRGPTIRGTDRTGRGGRLVHLRRAGVAVEPGGQRPGVAGVQPGDRVTLYGPNCWEWVVGYYAVAKAGAVVNPISSMLTPEEVRYVVKDSGARVLLTSVDKGIPLMGLVESGDLSHLVAWGDAATG